MAKQSAGLLLFREKSEIEVFLVHPGGPFYTNKDNGVWSIPKGEFDGEKPLDAARREFTEETGFKIVGEFIELEPVKQKGGKLVYCWAVEADVDETAIRSNTFEREWPPKSGEIREYPEVDRAGWFTPEIAKEKILPSQLPLIDQLLSKL